MFEQENSGTIFKIGTAIMEWFRGLFDRRVEGAGLPDGRYPRPGDGEFDSVAPHYDELMRAVPYDVWVDYIEKILRRRLVNPDRVLDLCCGTGRAAEEMTDRGYNVVGADLSEPMVRECGNREPVVTAAVMDAAQLALKEEQFELVFSVFDSLNYILEPADLQQTFHEVFAVLKSGGVLAFDLNTRKALKSGLFTQNNLNTNDSLLYSWRAHWDPERRICTVKMWYKWRGDDEEYEFHETHCERAYGDQEIKQMLREAGFTRIAVYDAYTFKSSTRKSNRAFYIARREPDDDNDDVCG